MTTQGETDTDTNSSEYLKTYKVVVLGEVAVGKTSIVQRFYNGKFSNVHQPTIGAMFLTKQITHGEDVYKFDIWDTAGQERFHALTHLYYKNAKAAIVVFDVTNEASFEKAKKWVNELLEKANSGIVIALCGNKIDLDDRKVQKEDAEKYASTIGSFYCEVSAKQNVNIKELFEQIIERLPKTEDEDEKGIKIITDEGNTTNGGRCGGYCSYI